MDQDRIQRIRQMEEIYDRVRKDLATLAQYEDSKLWQEDYEADERGEIPQDLKRGVLSQDGLDELFSRMRTGAPRYYRHFRNKKLYRLLAHATLEATGEEAVVYQAMYGEHGVWVRSRENFFEKVTHEGKLVPRFEELPVSVQKAVKQDYFEKADIALTVCAKDGTILDMNEKSRKTFLKPGREELIGANVLDCHPEPARSLLADMLEHPRTNIYTVEKEGLKKLIFQAPWYDGDTYAGLMELSIVLPEQIPNRIRKPKI